MPPYYLLQGRNVAIISKLVGRFYCTKYQAGDMACNANQNSPFRSKKYSQTRKNFSEALRIGSKSTSSLAIHFHCESNKPGCARPCNSIGSYTVPGSTLKHPFLPYRGRLWFNHPLKSL